jgi:hypothetical protein
MSASVITIADDLAGKGVHGPADAHADEQEEDERPEDVFGALVGATAAEKPEGDGNYERENYHGLKMAEPEFVWGHHAFSRRSIMLCGLVPLRKREVRRAC